MPMGIWIDRLKEYLGKLGIGYNIQQNPNTHGNTMECVIISQLGMFFPLIRPVLQRKYPDYIGFRQIPDLPVSSIEAGEEAEVWDITTGTGNFICQGILVHNCDSLHAVIPSAVKKNAIYMTAEEIAEELVRLRGISGTNWVTLSGGNPCMWDLTRLVQLLKGSKFVCAVETQGTLAPKWLTQCGMVVISPKSPGMGEKFEPDKFKNILKLCWANNIPCAVKVVVFSAQDLEFAVQVNAELNGAEPPYYMSELKFLSLGNPYPPELDEAMNIHDSSTLLGLSGDEDTAPGKSHRDRLLDEYKLLIEEFCQDSRLDTWRFLPQLHVLAYSNEAGR